MSSSEFSNEISLQNMTSEDLAARLRVCVAEQNVVLQADPQRKLNAVGAGTTLPLNLEIEGTVGDFVGLLSAEASYKISGNVGDCCGHSMLSGAISVQGAAGESLGAYAAGGFIFVLGKAGGSCGLGLRGADVFVRSTVGNRAGVAMQSGTLVLGNGAGDELGLGMQGGVIYVRGEVKSIAECVRGVRLKDADALRLSLLLARAGIKSDGKDFKAFRAKGV
ncbi:hypothetical protein [Aureliella helgolandensis]|uniref:GXGXG motif protein n=1 Tax=Aureliella helgolandensis TaxID=2527968 RepID=A0A518GDC0_9BACT|nr:hypothetical protein [Aureliella helgolandensis]QDV26589.1 GXGXG motif protein [Aureliella helgolandensis]